MKKIIASIFIWLISGLVLAFRSLLGPAQCAYEVGCTQYALIQLQEQNFFRALMLIGKRIVSCNPWFKGKING